MTQAVQRAREMSRACWRPRPVMAAWEWAERALVLHEGENPENVGPYSTALTPFVREIVDGFRDPAVSDLVVCKGSQTGLTLAIQAGVAWTVRNRPGNVLWVMPTDELARSFSETRWQPLLRGSGELAALIPDDSDRFRLMHQELGASRITFVGSNSPAKLASRPVPMVVMDETDKFAPATAKEANALDLAEQRTKKFAGAKRVKVSTPTTETGTIWKEYLKGDQRKLYMPCPHCGTLILFEWKNVKWDQDAKRGDGWDLKRVRASARYECPECEGRITDTLKIQMLARGLWQPTAEGAPGFRSYHLSSLYSPWASCSWGNLAVRFLQAREHYDLQGFTNGDLGEPWVLDAESVDPLDLMVRRAAYDADVPTQVLALVAGVDVQDDRLEAELVGFGAGAESWGVDYRVFWGDPGRPAVWAELDQWLLHDRGRRLAGAGVDTGGHHAGAVYRFCRPRLGRRVFALKGSSLRWQPTVDRNPSRKNKARCPVWMVGTDTAKALWLAWFRTSEPGPGYCHFPAAYDEEYFRQLGAEELRTRKVKGYDVREFHKTRERNEALDCRVYALAALEIAGGLNMLEILARRRKAEEEMKAPASEADEEMRKETETTEKELIRRPRRPRRRGSFVQGW